MADELTYWVKVSEHVYETEAPDPKDEWDNGAYGLNANLLEVARSNRKRSGWDLVNSSWDAPYGVDDIPAGGAAYVVFVEYTTGDTFGSSGAWCIAAIKEDPEEAREIAKRCEGDSDLPGGYRPWDGYFEHLNSVEVRPLLMQS